MSGADVSDHRSEFGVLAGWTTRALLNADPPTRLAAACRGSGSPAALAWLAESLRLAAGDMLLDVGSGLGGPSAWAAERYGTTPFAIDPMVEAAAGSRQLFGLDTVAGAAQDLPVRSATFDAAWCLGVLDTLEDPLAALREVRRVLRNDGRLGLIAFLADGPIARASAPRGNHFRSAEGLDRALVDAGFFVVDRSRGEHLPNAPVDWVLRQHRVRDVLAARHGDDGRWIEAAEQERRFGELLECGAVHIQLIHAVCI